jgi:hypothetical protein
MKFKTRMINAAVAAALGTVAGAAQAVNLGADGQGQVLLYSYYTVQNKGTSSGGNSFFDTIVTIVNSDSVNGKAVKVRFIEGKASREVLDFNLYLSPNDMWTGAVTRDLGNNPILRTSDNSCTSPEIPIVSTVAGGSPSGFGTSVTTVRETAFVNFLYANPNDAVNDPSLNRAREGYLEVIQMADLQPALLNTGGFNTFAAALHNQPTGVPPNCAGISASWQAGGYATPTDGVAAPTGLLSGTGTILNPLEGSDMSYDAVAIEGFSTVANHQSPGSIRPDLSEGSLPAVSSVLDGAGSLVMTDWTTTPFRAVSAVLDRNQVITEYAVLAQPVGLGTDSVLTFPTKRLHFLAGGANKAPFTSTLTTTGACESLDVIAYNREEGVQTTGLQFSPTRSSDTFALCWETNVISFRAPTSSGGTTSDALGSKSGIRTILQTPFDFGWLRSQLDNKSGGVYVHQMVSPATTSYVSLASSTPVVVTPVGVVTYIGLPVIGFYDQTFLNTTTGQAFGTAYLQRYTRRIGVNLP